MNLQRIRFQSCKSTNPPNPGSDNSKSTNPENLQILKIPVQTKKNPGSDNSKSTNPENLQILKIPVQTTEKQMQS